MTGACHTAFDLCIVNHSWHITPIFEVTPQGADKHQQHDRLS
jgi:hypothetical protein